MRLSIVSCVCWQSVYLLWRNVSLGLLPIFGLGCLFFWYWAAWAACKFWRLILCQLLHLPILSPILRVVFFFGFQQFDYDVSRNISIWFFCLGSDELLKFINVCMSFTKFMEIFLIISSSTFCLSVVFCFHSRTPKDPRYTICYCPTNPQRFVQISLFFFSVT